MSSIGNMQCDFVHGSPSFCFPKFEKWEVPGADGYGVRLIGVRAESTTLEAVRFTSKVGANSFSAYLRSLIGYKVNIIDDMKRPYKLWIEKVGQMKISPARMPCDNKVEVRVSIQISGIMC